MKVTEGTYCIIINKLVTVHTYQLLEQSSVWDHLSEGHGCFCFFPLVSGET